MGPLSRRKPPRAAHRLRRRERSARPAARHGRRGGRGEGEPQRDGPRADHRPDLEGLDQLASAERRATCPEPFHNPNASPIPASRSTSSTRRLRIDHAASIDRRTRPGAYRRSPSGEADGAFRRRGAARAAVEGAGGANRAAAERQAEASAEPSRTLLARRKRRSSRSCRRSPFASEPHES